MAPSGGTRYGFATPRTTKAQEIFANASADAAGSGSSIDCSSLVETRLMVHRSFLRTLGLAFSSLCATGVSHEPIFPILRVSVAPRRFLCGLPMDHPGCGPRGSKAMDERLACVGVTSRLDSLTACGVWQALCLGV